ncbi:ribosomal protein S18-alanine N-acetyltransferase [Geminocystis herdmanii]|uniref:ribosomal protein S18-alanine N-acetyltransferase n=1 Tax=Geminocystis herdmanii TaxID=669359 RepID=UPI000346696F|nr:ribosomal protein S18-alanine N-acetyltransferase [Geminocystis herdmanii]
MSLEIINIKNLTKKELDQVLELDHLCFGGLWSLDGYKREIESPNSCLLVLTIDINNTEKVIGLGCFWSILEEAHLTILAIHPDFQGQGFGKLLLTKLLKEAQNKSLERATLEVGENNIKALSLYEKFGFKEAGRRKKYYKSTGEDALILWKQFEIK